MDAAVQAQLRQQSEARAYGEVGRLLMAAEYFEAAEPYLLHAQAQAPEDVRWPYYLGHVHMANAEPGQGGRARFSARCSCSRTTSATLVWLGNLHLDQGSPELAEPLFARAVSAQPKLVAGLFGLGRTALARRDFAPRGGLPGAGAGGRPARDRGRTTRWRSPIAAWATRPRRRRTCASAAASRWARRIR